MFELLGAAGITSETLEYVLNTIQKVSDLLLTEVGMTWHVSMVSSLNHSD